MPIKLGYPMAPFLLVPIFLGIKKLPPSGGVGNKQGRHRSTLVTSNARGKRRLSG